MRPSGRFFPFIPILLGLWASACGPEEEPTPDVTPTDAPANTTPGSTAAPTPSGTPASTPIPTPPSTPATTPEPTPLPASTLKVGAGVASLLPLVNGNLDYAQKVIDEPPAMAAGDAGTDPVVFVRQWDLGTLGIGNGFPTSHWVHDEIRTAAAAFEDTTRSDGKILVFITADLYMLFRQDLEGVYEKMRAELGDNTFDRLFILVSASHNHQGPDTAGLDGPINHEHYDYFTTQMAAAAVAAVRDLQPARLKVNTTRFQFGTGDGEAPLITDPTLGTLQAWNADTGKIITTLVQWAAHPETTLWFNQPVTSVPQCEYLQTIGEAYEYDDGDPDTFVCTSEGQYISADFPGYMTWHLMELTGAPVLYFNGALGSMISTLNVEVWETEGRGGQPVGDGVNIPEGATVLPKSFHKMAVIGKELANRVKLDLEQAEVVSQPTLNFERRTFFTPLNNIGFRVGLCVKPRSSEPVLLGDRPRELFTCDPLGQNCVSDEFAAEQDPVLGVPRRIGDHLETEASRVQIGPVEILTVPGELVPELGSGLPSNFYNNINYFYPGSNDMEEHVSGTDYTLLGWIKATLPGPHRWLLGLTPDELGYFVPLSDWRIWCVADDETFSYLGTSCSELYQQGVIDYPDGVAGQRCKDITDAPDLLTTYSESQAQALLAICTYGQTFGEVPGHYVQTVAAGWDMVEDYFGVVEQLTGYSDPWTQVNPDFEAVNQQQ